MGDMLRKIARAIKKILNVLVKVVKVLTLADKWLDDNKDKLNKPKE